MARTALGRQLTDLHRTAQGRIATATVAALLPVWKILDPADLDATSADWIATALPIIAHHRTVSADTAAAYLRAYRAVETGQPIADLDLPAAQPLNESAASLSLLVTGPVAIKARIGSGVDLRTALDLSLAGSAASAARHAVNGGRELTLDTAQTDRRANGYRRVTSPGACAFCEEIAGYSEGNEALRGDFQCHDGCNCQPELVYG